MKMNYKKMSMDRLYKIQSDTSGKYSWSEGQKAFDEAMRRMEKRNKKILKPLPKKKR